MLADLARAFLGAIAAGVLPGYFWAGFLRPAGGLGERLAWSAALSLASVPVLALALARAFGTGITLWVAIVSIAVVLGSGALARILRGAPAGPDGPVLPRPRAIRDARTLALLVAAFGLALASALGLPSPWWLLMVILAALVVAGALAAWRTGPPWTAGGESAAAAGAESAAAGAASTGPASTGPASIWGGSAEAGATGTKAGWQLSPVLREPVLAIVLAFTALRAYTGPIRHDWPYLRGGDQFSHAVMAEQMLAHGSYGTYLIYPPGFSTLTAVICRLSGLTPLALFPVLAPALLVLTTLAAYALATRLWGWEYGLAAAALSGLVLRGPYTIFAEGRYPDLVAAYFLLVMLVSALITLYGSPSARSGLLVAVVGGSVVLYHSVATLYLALLLAVVAIVGLPYLLLQARRTEARQDGRAERRASTRRRPGRVEARAAGGADSPAASRAAGGAADRVEGRSEGSADGRLERPAPGRAAAGGVGPAGGPVAAGADLRAGGGPTAAGRLASALVLSLVGLGLLSVVYAAYTYLPGKSGAGTSATSTAVSIAVGSQPVLSVPHVLAALSSAVVWLGIFGLVALVAGIRYLRQPGQVLAAMTLLLWCGLMYAGSRTAVDGFPQRFEHDLGGSLSVLGALGAVLILQSLVRWREPSRVIAVLAAVAASTVVAIAGLQALRATEAESHAVHFGILDPDVAAAGAWLGRHNTGGTIISTPAMNSGITNRAVLAMGGYTGLQSYSAFRIAHPRSLPTAGRAPLLDSQEVLLHPGSCRVAGIVAGQDVRYIVLYRFGHAAELAGFQADPARYRRVFENPSVVIYVPSPAPGKACPGAH